MEVTSGARKIEDWLRACLINRRWIGPGGVQHEADYHAWAVIAEGSAQLIARDEGRKVADSDLEAAASWALHWVRAGRPEPPPWIGPVNFSPHFRRTLHT